MLAAVPSTIEHETRLEEIPIGSGHDAAPNVVDRLRDGSGLRGRCKY